MEVEGALEQGRVAYAASAWATAVEALTLADDGTTLRPEDLEFLATAQFMVGHEVDHLVALERAHHAHLDAGARLAAAACAFWIGMRLFMAGETSRAGGWLGRARRLVEQDGRDCVERGYLLLPDVFRREAGGDGEGAVTAAQAAAVVGERFRDSDLFALATHVQGHLLIGLGRVQEGLALLDEAMLTVTSGAASPIPSGIVYCGAIDSCRAAFDPRRAREWTAALHAWCERQPDMLAFTGDCHVHRAEIMQLNGAWSDALEELERAARRAELAGSARVAAHAAYRKGEILRLRGELAAAEKAYREAAHGGREPQPGLALLRLATGDADAAVAAIHRVLGETTAPDLRAIQLVACVEISLRVRDHEAARAACTELESIAADRPSEMLTALAEGACGAVQLAEDDARSALPSLRLALGTWLDLGASYEAARVRLLIARACRLLGDEDSAALELDAARVTFALLGTVELADDARATHGLTARELEVLRLVASGATNKAVAADLVLSERTIDRHVSNIFAKLGVSTRAAATAAAYERRLI